MPTTPVVVSSITAADWQPELGVQGGIVTGIDDVAQCIQTILTTPKGSVPFQPAFGSDLWRYVDWPLAAARPYIVRETVGAIAAWEPRAMVLRVTVDQGVDDAIGQISITLEWQLANASTPVQSTVIALGATAGVGGAS